MTGDLSPTGWETKKKVILSTSWQRAQGNI